MGRPPRIDPDGGWHHVMNRGVDRQAIFLDDNDRVEFGPRLADLHRRFGTETHAYCLMDNHFHCLLRCPHGGLSAAMQHLGSVYTRHVNDRHGRDGPLLRGRFHSRHITEEPHLLHTCRYIHRNPLDIVGVDDVAGYRWSSHRTYLGHRQQPAWMTTEVILAAFDGDPVQFDAFVRSGLPDGVRAESSCRTVIALRAAVQSALVSRADEADGRLRSTSRAVTLWLTDLLDVERTVVMAALGIDTDAAYRSALSRARASVGAEEMLRRSAFDALDLAGLARDGVASGV